jgi:gluconolactonase
MSDLYEIWDRRFNSCVLPNARLETLGENFGWLEGPVWFADQDCLLVSDIPSDRILRWTRSSGVSTFRQPSRFANGHTRDRQGRLIGCSHQDRCITRTERDGSITTLVSHYGGKRLNSPNDVICKSDDTIWFSDPHYGINTDYEGGKQTPELPAFLYRLDPRDGSLRVMADDFAGPNGLALSPDEGLLYVSETGKQFAENPERHIRVFDVAEDGERLSHGRIFHTVTPGFADGFRVDVDGNLWTSAVDGVHCIAADGTRLGRIVLPCTTSNLVFGGRHNAQLFICAAHTLYALYTNQRGLGYF